MKNRGYTPWVARKAPLFNTTLNAKYIRISAIYLIVAVTYAAGIMSGLALTDKIKPYFSFIGSFSNSTNPTPPMAIKKVEKIQAKIAEVSPLKAEVHIVPAIPMGDEKAAKQELIEDILKNEYQLTMYEATNVINAAKQAYSRTGIEPSLLLAIAAETRKFKINDGNKFVGIMGVNVARHPEIIKTLKSENISYITVEGGFILGAEVLKKYQTANNNDINAAIEKFMGINAGDPALSKLQMLKSRFELAIN